MVITDMNDRERKRYADQMEGIGKAATALAEALRIGDDTAAAPYLAVLAMCGAPIIELAEIFMQATGVSVPDRPAVIMEHKLKAWRIGNRAAWTSGDGRSTGVIKGLEVPGHARLVDDAGGQWVWPLSSLREARGLRQSRTGERVE